MIKMRICIIAGGYLKDGYIGGSELQSFYIAKEFVKLGHNVTFLSIISKQNKPDFDTNEGFTIYRIRKIPILGMNFFSFRSKMKLINADIYYMRLFKYHFPLVLLSKILNKPSVYNISSDTDCGKFTTLGKKSTLSQKTIHYINSLGLKYTSKIISQTVHQKRLLGKNFRIESFVIKNGHPVPQEKIRKNYPCLIVWIANIKKLKQPEIFIDLAKACHDLDVKFIFAGKPANNAYQDMLMSKLKKSSNIQYLGQISFEKTNELLSKASIFVNTSLPQEGFSNTFIQAWLRETPVVSLNVDPDDILKRYEIGFHSKTLEQLVKDVRYLIENEGERKDMGKRAREYAVEHHDIEKIGKRYLEVFEELIEK